MRIRWRIWGGGSVPLLDPAYRGSGALTSVITHSCVIVLRCCPRRWIDAAFSATKSLGVHTGAGSENSNTTLSRPAKQDNVSCPIRASLAQRSEALSPAKRETLPASHFTNETAFWVHSKWTTMLQILVFVHLCLLVIALICPLCLLLRGW